MNKTFARPIFLLLGLTVFTVAISTVSAQAETPDTLAEFDSVQTPSFLEEELFKSDDTLTPEPEITEQAEEQLLEPEIVTLEKTETGEPTPGTVATSVDPLFQSPETAPATQTSSETTEPTESNDSSVAQVDFDPGRTTRGGSSYIGVGGNIGFSGDTAVGDGSFAINGKLGLTPTLSVRPAVLIGDDTTFLVPLTYDLNIRQAGPFERAAYSPFLGGGAVFSTDDIGFLLTGGIDIPLSPEFVANAAVNVGFIEDSTDVGLLIGVGYTFQGF